MADTISVPHFKPGVTVPITLSLYNVNGLYTIYEYLTTALGKEGALTLKAKIETRQPLSSLEMSVLSISTILHLVHESGKANDLITMQSVSAQDIVNTLSTQPVSNDSSK